jgi:Lectin C-type domain
MKNTLTFLTAAAVLTISSNRSNADVLAGPIVNPDNGHEYYLLTPNTWSGSEVEAENLGGTLAIIKNADQQQWIFSQFATNGGASRVLWIGLRRQYEGGPFEWVDGTPLNYINWCSGQPDNASGVEDKGEIWTPLNGWNDERNTEQNYGVVEVPGNSHEKSLTHEEKSLVGNWFEGGRTDHPCYITATSDRLFAIGNFGRSGRIIYDPSGSIFVSSWNAHGEIIQDTILWSNGTWWSRKPSRYTSTHQPSDDHVIGF